MPKAERFPYAIDERDTLGGTWWEDALSADPVPTSGSAYTPPWAWDPTSGGTGATPTGYTPPWWLPGDALPQTTGQQNSNAGGANNPNDPFKSFSAWFEKNKMAGALLAVAVLLIMKK